MDTVVNKTTAALTIFFLNKNFILQDKSLISAVNNRYPKMAKQASLITLFCFFSQIIQKLKLTIEKVERVLV